MPITNHEPPKQLTAGATGHAIQQSIFRSWPLFAVLGVISVAIWLSPLLASFALAMHDDQYTHILLILPISAALIFLDWKDLYWKDVKRKELNSTARVEKKRFHSGVKIGVALLAIAVLTTAAVRWRSLPSSYDGQLSMNMLAFVLWWIGAFILCFGTRSFRRALFPLCFLFFIVPFPQVVLNPIVSFLQHGSATAAHLLFAVAAIPVAQRGALVHIPGLTMEVAPECSSIRSSMILLVTTTVLAHLLLRSPWRKTVVVAAAIPLSVAKNGLRIFVLGMLATHVDPNFLTGRLHRQGGIIFLLIALGMIFLLIGILRRGECDPTIDESSQT